MNTLMTTPGLTSLRREMDRLFDRFWEPDLGELPTLGEWSPRLDMTESRDAVTIRAEVPGIEPKDIQVMFEDGVLTIRGEKKEEKEEKDARYYRMERSWGSFSRALRVPSHVDGNKVTATFKNGVLSVTMPKTAEAKGMAIPVKVA